MNDLETLRELNRGYVRAAETSDVAWYDQHLHPHFMSWNPDGNLVDKVAFLERMAGPYRGSKPEAVDVHLRIVGSLGIVQSGFRDLAPDGRERKGCYTDVWQNEGGTWRCLSAHFVIS